MTYIRPMVFESKFTCPHCDAIAKQTWEARTEGFSQFEAIDQNAIRVATCDNCSQYSLWHEETMVYPDCGIAPPPNADMPSDVKQYYFEAANIAVKSPRSAAALLRAGVKLLCKELGEDNQNLEIDIAVLVRKGLPVTIQQALDAVRVIGRDAVYPGQIDSDSSHVVERLFELLNLMVEYLVTLPNRVDSLYDHLATEALELVQQRA